MQWLNKIDTYLTEAIHYKKLRILDKIYSLEGIL